MFSTEFYLAYLQFVVTKLHSVADKLLEKAKLHDDIAAVRNVLAQDARKEAARARSIAEKIGSLFE